MAYFSTIDRQIEKIIKTKKLTEEKKIDALQKLVIHVAFEQSMEWHSSPVDDPEWMAADYKRTQQGFFETAKEFNEALEGTRLLEGDLKYDPKYAAKELAK
jgi:hypothetical protein